MLHRLHGGPLHGQTTLTTADVLDENGDPHLQPIPSLETLLAECNAYVLTPGGYVHTSILRDELGDA